MCEKICLMCFSLSLNVKDIKDTQLQKVYELITETKIQADFYPLCYICFAKLLRCHRLIKTVQQHNTENQPQVRQLVHLGVFNTESLSLNDAGSDMQPDIKGKNFNHEQGRTSGSYEIEIDFKLEYIKKEKVESPVHSENETAIESVEDKHIPTEQHVGKSHTCDICSRKFSYLSDLKRHKQIHTDSKPHGCGLCDKTFSCLSHLKRHELTHSGVKPYACDSCDKTFNLVGNLNKHKKIHTNDKPHSCDVCSRKFPRLRNLKIHIKVAHTEVAPDKLYTCDVCDKKFVLQQYLKRHELTHNKGEYNCNICNKKFSHLRALNRHKESHSVQNSYFVTCDICSKNFASASSLNSHKQVVHTSVAPDKLYACDLCSKKYPKEISLKRHQLTHAVKKVYSCDVCSKSFSYSYSLKTHKLIHTGVKPYICDVCNKSFSQSGALNRHKMLHQNTTTVTE